MPVHCSFVVHRGAQPGQVKLRQPTATCQGQADLADLIFVMQALRQKTQTLQQPKTINTQPEAVIHGFNLRGDTTLRTLRTLSTTLYTNPPDRLGEQLGTKHFLKRPANAQIVRKSRRRVFQMLRKCTRLITNHAKKTLTLLRRHVGKVGQGFGCRTDIAERPAAAFGQRLNQPVTSRIALVGCRNVIEGDDKAGDCRSGHTGHRLSRCGEHRQHMGTQQTPTPRHRHKLRCDPGLFTLPLLQTLKGMGNQTSFKNRVDRTAQTKQFIAWRFSRAAQLLPCPLVVEEDTAIEIADDHALVEIGHQGSQTRALLFQRRTRLANTTGDIQFQRIARCGQLIDGATERAQLHRTVLGKAHPAMADQRINFLGHA